MEKDKQIEELRQQLLKVQNDLSVLAQNYYKGNFSSYQDFSKACNFTTTLTIPRYDTLPSCEVGQICENSGKLMICSATDTWTIVGTQTA